MGSKLKMKAPKKNRVLESDNQMSQAFARAMQNSRKELEIMQDQAYNDGFNTGDDWANTINSVTGIKKTAWIFNQKAFRRNQLCK